MRRMRWSGESDERSVDEREKRDEKYEWRLRLWLLFPLVPPVGKINPLFFPLCIFFWLSLPLARSLSLPRIFRQWTGSKVFFLHSPRSTALNQSPTDLTKFNIRRYFDQFATRPRFPEASWMKG